MTTKDDLLPEEIERETVLIELGGVLTDAIEFAKLLQAHPNNINVATNLHHRVNIAARIIGNDYCFREDLGEYNKLTRYIISRRKNE